MLQNSLRKHANPHMYANVYTFRGEMCSNLSSKDDCDPDLILIRQGMSIRKNVRKGEGNNEQANFLRNFISKLDFLSEMTNK